MKARYRKCLAALIRYGALAVLLGMVAQPAVAGISFGYGYPGFHFGYRDYGHFRGGDFGFFHPYAGPRSNQRHGHVVPRYRGGFRPYSHRPYRHYKPRRFYRPHRFHRYRRY